MNNIKIFDNPEFGKIRTTEHNGEVWFIGKDVCEMFGDKNHNRSIGRVDSVDKIQEEIIDSMGRRQIATFVNESGLYALLFAMQPQKANNDGVQDAYPIEVQERIDKVRRFKRWVTYEVLPTIRKHGAYMTEDALKKAIQQPDFLIQLATELKAEQEARKQAEAKIQADAPKVLFANAVSASDRDILIGELAKILKQNGIEIGQKRLFDWMREHGYLIRAKGDEYNNPTQRSLEMELFRIKKAVINNSDGTVITKKTTVVTPKGQIYFVNKFLKEMEKNE